MNLVKFIVFLLLFHSSLWAVDFIHDRDGQRALAYDRDHDESDARPHTTAICDRLGDHAGIDYSRVATVEERRTIFVAICGSVIIHDDPFEALYQRQASVTDARYDRHLNAVWVVDQSARLLWDRVRVGQYVHSLRQVDAELQGIASQKGINYRLLLTDNFITWFYTALDNYQAERNPFGGTATVDWFNQATTQCAAGDVKKVKPINSGFDATHQYICGERGNVIAVLKPKSDDWKLWFVARAAGLQGVVNPVIPVRVDGFDMVIDYSGGFTHCVEPSVGFVGRRDGTEFQPPSLHRLLSHVLTAGPMEHQIREGHRTDDSRDLASFTAHTGRFMSYFENDAVPAAQRFKDLVAFNAAISSGNLLDISVWWQLLAITDMHDSNLMWTTTAAGELRIVSIDYGMWGRRIADHPPIHTLLQSTQPLSATSKASVEAITWPRIGRVCRHCNLIGANMHDRLDTIKEIVRDSTTVRDAMHRFYDHNARKKSGGYGDPKRVEFCGKVSVALGHPTGVYDPLVVLPLGSYMGPDLFKPHFPQTVAPLDGYAVIRREDVAGICYFDDYDAYQVRQCDWVFSVTTVKDLREGRYLHLKAQDKYGNPVYIEIRDPISIATMLKPENLIHLPRTPEVLAVIAQIGTKSE